MKTCFGKMVISGHVNFDYIHHFPLIMNVIKVSKLIKQNSSQNVVFKIRTEPSNIWNVNVGILAKGGKLKGIPIFYS
jgi:hypothetical protein